MSSTERMARHALSIGYVNDLYRLLKDDVFCKACEQLAEDPDFCHNETEFHETHRFKGVCLDRKFFSATSSYTQSPRFFY